MVGKSETQRYVVVVFDGVSLGILSFAAHQEPQVLADDLREFYHKLA